MTTQRATTDDSVVVPLQCPISVFTNEAGGVTIEQDQMGEYGDIVSIAIGTPAAVRSIIAALQREIGDA